MLISLCLPCHNRTHDLKLVMPYLIGTANFSPPVEIVVINYNSQDDLHAYMTRILETPLADGNSIVYKRYIGRNHYHMAHARNLSVLASSGDYFVITSADIYFEPHFIRAARNMLELYDYTWLYDERYCGVIVCKREEFIAAGGYDERFEFYGPEDRELDARLRRRGGKVSAGLPGVLPAGLVHVFPTPNSDKVKGYRLPLSKREMHEVGLEILTENNANGVLVANPEGWGKWEH